MAIYSLSRPPLGALYPSDGDKVDAVFKRVGLEAAADVNRRLRGAEFSFAHVTAAGGSIPSAHALHEPATPDEERERKRDMRIAVARAERGHVGGGGLPTVLLTTSSASPASPPRGGAGGLPPSVTMMGQHAGGSSILLMARDGSMASGAIVHLPPLGGAYGASPPQGGRGNGTTLSALALAGAAALGGGKAARPETMALTASNAAESIGRVAVPHLYSDEEAHLAAALSAAGGGGSGGHAHSLGGSPRYGHAGYKRIPIGAVTDPSVPHYMSPIFPAKPKGRVEGVPAQAHGAGLRDLAALAASSSTSPQAGSGAEGSGEGAPYRGV